MTGWESETYRVPLGHHSLFFEPSEFSAIVDGGEQLPQQQKCQTDENDSGYYSENDSEHVNLSRTLFFTLYFDD